MKCGLIKNKYYTSEAQEYCIARLAECLEKLGVRAEACSPTFRYDDGIACDADFDFAISFSKDARLISAIERSGRRVINSSDCIVICDDKEATYSVLSGTLALPVTIPSPQYYPVSTQPDLDFLQNAAERLGYPLVVKQNIGSLGEQVEKIETIDELIAAHTRLLHTPHVLQQYVQSSSGKDLRVYIVGGEPYAAVMRVNTKDFRSNVNFGGIIRPARLTSELVTVAKRAAAALGLFFGSIDFLTEQDKLLFLEANSNAYFMSLERETGVMVAEAIAEAVIQEIND